MCCPIWKLSDIRRERFEHAKEHVLYGDVEEKVCLKTEKRARTLGRLGHYTSPS